MSPEDVQKSLLYSIGSYELSRMPFGLKNASAEFQRLMNTDLAGIQGIKCFVYTDDIVVYADSFQDHFEKLTVIFREIRKANLKLQPEKRNFLRQEVVYLSH